mmetsp:Transcript_10134/g.21273  ORF Transcript_10134/g.21273 Transcript_10134/m.21273 type:complete len:358 (-) Transcript_10134:3210-4283(-)
MARRNNEEGRSSKRSKLHMVLLAVVACCVIALVIIKHIPSSPSVSINPNEIEGLRSVRRLKTCPNNKTPFTIEIQTDNFGGDISWSLSKLSPLGVETPFKNSNQEYGNNQKYERQICLRDGDYLFEVDDNYGDGICCAQGQGHAAVFQDGEELLRVRRFKDIASNVFRVGYDPLPEMTQRDKAWVDVHNEYRKQFHEDNGETYVPLRFDASLKKGANEYLDSIMDDCDAAIHAEDGATWGTNILSEKGFGKNNKLDDPEEVLHHWVDQQENRSWPKNSALTQVYWRGSHYLGCASAKKDGCEMHLCRYYPAGNCAMGNKSNSADNWKTPVLQNYSDCGGPKRCPDDGCYIVDDKESI